MPNAGGRKPGRWRRWAGAGLGLVLLVGLIAGFVALRPYGQTGTTYLAKQLCSCIYLTGRSDASCQNEFKPDSDKFQVRIDHAARSVSARLLVFSNEAVYEDGLGCRITR
jgi:hypothetical protein